MISLHPVLLLGRNELGVSRNSFTLFRVLREGLASGLSAMIHSKRLRIVCLSRERSPSARCANNNNNKKLTTRNSM